MRRNSGSKTGWDGRPGSAAGGAGLQGPDALGVVLEGRLMLLEQVTVGEGLREHILPFLAKASTAPR